MTNFVLKHFTSNCQVRVTSTTEDTDKGILIAHHVDSTLMGWLLKDTYRKIDLALMFLAALVETIVFSMMQNPITHFVTTKSGLNISVILYPQAAFRARSNSTGRLDVVFEIDRCESSAEAPAHYARFCRAPGRSL